jgi:hypothetical protein
MPAASVELELGRELQSRERPPDYDESSARRDHQASAAVIALSASWMPSPRSPAVAAQCKGTRVRAPGSQRCSSLVSDSGAVPSWASSSRRDSSRDSPPCATWCRLAAMSYSRSLTLAKSRSKVAHDPSDSSPRSPFVVPMNRSAWQSDLLPELGKLASQLAHPMHDRLAAGSEPAACEADRVTQLAEGSVVVERFGRTGLPDCFERSVKASEILE